MALCKHYVRAYSAERFANMRFFEEIDDIYSILKGKQGSFLNPMEGNLNSFKN